MTLPLLLILSCVPKSQVEALRAQNAALQEQNELLMERLDAAASAAAPQEAPAQALYEEAMRHYNLGELAEAKVLLGQLLDEHPDTRAALQARRLHRELQVVGMPAPDRLDVEQWYQGSMPDLLGAPVTVLVFWEEWCPHCRREVPLLNETYLQLRGQGLSVVGLTRLTHTSTEEATRQFIREAEIAFPVGKEGGTASEYFAVSGIPAAAVLKDGEVVWRGHPARLSVSMLEELLAP